MPDVSHVSRLTQAGIERMKAPKKGRIQKRDSIVPGLCIRISETGLKSYSLITRLHKKQLRVPIGQHGVIKLTEARDKARAALALVEKGINPNDELRRAKEAPTDTVEDVAEDYIKRYVEVHNRPRSAVETNRALRQRIAPAWKGRSIRDITRRDIIDLLEDIATEAPATANRTKATISGLFNWCLDRGILDTSPAVRLKAPAPIVERERVLSDDEIKRLWPAFEKQGEPFGAYFKVLLLTGQRRSEAATMQWDHVDLDDGLWSIPAELTKANRSHECPLSPMAVEILRDMKRLGDFVFTTRGNKPISGFSKAKAAVERDAKGIKEAWRLHDLRRTCGTGLARLGIADATISRVLNHAEGGVTKIYKRYGYLDEKRSALNAWGSHIESLLGHIPDNVVPIREAVK